MGAVTFLLAVVACSPAPGPACGAVPPEAGCVRVLFIGNSYTAVNDLPSVFATVAKAHGRRVYVEMIASGGARLADHVASVAAMARIRDGRWTHVILQEQSLLPAVQQARQEQMFPAARTLAAAVDQAGARTVFLATWGRRDGWIEGGIRDYSTMQSQVTDGYRTIAGELHAIVAPVGDAWSAVAAANPDIPLWQADGSHPTVQGTFLAANVLFVTLFHEAPRGLGSRGRVPEVHVYRLQQAAAHSAGEFLATPPAASAR